MTIAIVTAALLIAVDTGHVPTAAAGSNEVKAGLSTNKVEVAKPTTGQVAPVKADEEKHMWTADRILGVGFASSGVVLALVGLDQFVSAERLTRDARQQLPPQMAADVAHAREQSLLGGVCLGAGVASLVGGVALFFWHHGGGSTTELTAAFMPGGTGLSVRRRF